MRARHLDAMLNGGRPLLPSQEALLRSNAYIQAILGAWRSGKTRGAAFGFLRGCAENPWEGRSDQPFSIIAGPTISVLKDSALRELKAILPKEAIYYEQRSPSYELTLSNGHLIKLKSYAGIMEGPSACVVWLEEAHRIRDAILLSNYFQRASDPEALVRRVIVSGLPKQGPLFDQFGPEAIAGDPERFVVHVGMEQNKYLNPLHVAQARKTTTRSGARMYLLGEWESYEDAVFYEFSAGAHVVRDRGNRLAPVMLGVDVGRGSSVVFAQENMREVVPGSGKTERTLHVVDEVIGRNLDTEQLMRAAAGRGWRIDPKVSKIYIDPTRRSDEIQSIRRVLGTEIGIITQSRGTEEERCEHGYEAVNVALRDADGMNRLTFSDQLSRAEGSLLDSLPRIRRGPGGRVSAQDKWDHPTDALRYLVVGRLPLTARARAA